MKFMNFSLPGNPDFRLGVQIDERCLDLTAAHRAGQVDFLTANLLEDVIHQANGIQDLEGRLASVDMNSLEGFMIPLSEVQPRPPVLHPQKIIGIGLNYRDHAQEVGRKEPKAPLLFAMFANAIIGHNEEIVIPAMTQKPGLRGRIRRDHWPAWTTRTDRESGRLRRRIYDCERRVRPGSPVRR